MFYFYVIKSKKDNQLYFGYTSDLKNRFKEHNSGQTKSTKNRRPFILVYYEGYLSKRDAMQREYQIKRRAKTLISLKKRIKNSLSEGVLASSHEN
ncbi:MAG: GIY-YIG nuclease family protein [Patescibacteria group bacterium]